MNSAQIPSLPKHVRIRREDGSGRAMLLYPEGALELDACGLAILEMCDARRSVGSIADLLAERFDGDPGHMLTDAEEFLAALEERGLVQAANGGDA